MANKSRPKQVMFRMSEQEAMTEVGSVKREYARKEKLLADERAEAQRRTQEAESQKQSLKADTEKRAKELFKTGR